MSAIAARPQGSNGRDAGVQTLEDELRAVQDLPDKPHGRGLAVVNKRDESQGKVISFSANFLSVVILILAQTVAVVWWARGIDAETTRLKAENVELKATLREMRDMNDAKVFNLSTRLAELSGANEFAQYLDGKKKQGGGKQP